MSLESEFYGVRVYLRSLKRVAESISEKIASAIESTHPAWLDLLDIGDISVTSWGRNKTSNEDIEFLREHLRTVLRELRAAERIADNAVEDIDRVIEELPAENAIDQASYRDPDHE